ncbi:MAG: four helix bundle protein [Phycisphaerae bacterium]|nr:four helix bundle protein [Phycisphaerae bacterium]
MWQKAHVFALEIYKISSAFPQNEIYGLVSQMRRAAVSIPSNISEGCGRLGNSELKQFLGVSMGSANEIEYQLLLACDLGYISRNDYKKLNSDIEEIRKMLASYIKKINKT